MAVTIVLLLVGVLLFLVIVYNILQQYKQKLEADKRALIAKQRAIIEETEEVLLNASRLPYSRELVTILYKRILDALLMIKQKDPNIVQLNQRINNIEEQLKQVQTASGEENAFRTPDSDKQAVLMLQLLKKIRAILRSEHAKGRIATQVYVLEDRRLELTQLKVNVENLIKRATDARLNRQFGTTKQLLARGIQTLEKISDRDAFLDKRLQMMVATRMEIEEQLKQQSAKDLQDKQEKEVDELDVLFQPKKKW